MTGRRFGLIGANAAASDYQFLLIDSGRFSITS